MFIIPAQYDVLDPAERTADLAVVNRNGYRATLATRIFKIDELVFPVVGECMDHPTVYTIQVAANRHVVTLYGKYVNHSCHPNCCFDTEHLIFRALRTIAAEEEITFDYNTTEYDLCWPFQCCCGAIDCLRYIRGYKYLSAEHRQRLVSLTADYLKSMRKADQ